MTTRVARERRARELAQLEAQRCESLWMLAAHSVEPGSLLEQYAVDQVEGCAGTDDPTEPLRIQIGVVCPRCGSAVKL
jgi:hypothetical protein